MSDVLTIGVFLQELNIPTLKRQADALELLQREIDKLFKSKIEPDLAKIARGYGREKFIQKVVADGLEYYYNEFKKYIQEDYSTEFKKLLQGIKFYFWIQINLFRGKLVGDSNKRHSYQIG